LSRINTIPHNGLIRYLGLLNQERLLVASPKALAEVLTVKTYDFPKPPQVQAAVGRILGVGVIVAEGDEHKAQRKLLMPAFAFRHIKNLYPVFWTKSREMVQAMSGQLTTDAGADAAKQGDKTAGEFEIGNWASRAALDIIGVAGLGRDFGALQDPNNELNKTYRRLFRPSRAAQRLAILGLFLPTWIVNRLPVRRNDDIEHAAQFIRATCRDLIREKKEQMARKEALDPDITSVALESGGFTDEKLVDQLMTFLAAGHETTGSSLTWATYLLCRHPDVQTRLRDEVRSRLPPLSDPHASISSADIDSMPYLNAFCSEVLRYFAPLPLTPRIAARDTSICGETIPKGTRLFLGIWALNKDKALWGDDALEFRPERWLPRHEGAKPAASGGATSNYGYMTFLHGPRSCMGQNFAKAEMACLVAALVGSFEMELRDKALMDEDKLEIKGGLARPADGLWIRARVLDDGGGGYHHSAQKP
jgi:cytochrome P450